MTDVAGLWDYRCSSYWYLHRPARRPDFLDCSGALEAAGGLADTCYGHKKYAEYLRWLSTNKQAQKEMAFEKMCRGWALGTKDFKKALVVQAAEEVNPSSAQGGDASARQARKVPRYDGDTLREANELRWELALEQCLFTQGKTNQDCEQAIKSADWKVMIAAALKQATSATNVWIAAVLNMGVPHAVSRYVGIFKQSGEDQSDKFNNLIANITS